MRNGDLVVRDGKQYRVDMYTLFEKPHRHKTSGKMGIGYGSYFDVATKRLEGGVFVYADGTYTLAPRKAARKKTP